MRARLSAAVTLVKRDQMNILQEIEERRQSTEDRIAKDYYFRLGTRAREQAQKDLKNLDILQADLEYTVKTYPVSLLGEDVPVHFIFAK